MPRRDRRGLDGRDSESKPYVQAAPAGNEERLAGSAENAEPVVPGADAQVASEPMSADATLSRLGKTDATRVPPGRQLSGEPPAV